jgi:hypothetical protein
MRKLFVVGHAKPPKGLSAADVYSTLSLALVVENRHGVILEASCSLVTEAGKNFVRELLVGRSLVDDRQAVLDLLRAQYHGAASAAIQAAWKDAVRQFEQIQADEPPS